MRRLIVPIAITLALATGAVLAETRMVLEPAPIGALRDDRAANTDLVRRWYEAVNRAIRTGEVAGLDEVVAEGFVAHTGWSGGASGRAALDDYLRGLHATHPAVRLVVLDLTAEGDRVVARVRVEGAAQGESLGVPLTDARIWSSVDVFRLEAHAIVEHWSDGAPLARFAPLVTVSITVPPPMHKTVSLERRTYAAGRSQAISDAGGFVVVLVETGELRLDAHRLATGAAWRVVSPRNGSAAPRPVVPGSSAILQAGDALLAGDGALGTIENGGTRVAVALVLSVASMDGQSALDPWYLWKASGSAATPVVAPNPAAVTVDLLAGGLVVELPAGDAVVAIGRAMLPAPGGVAPHAVAGAELLSVAAGGAVLATGVGGAWVRRGEGVQASHLETALLAGREGAMLQRGVEVRYRSVDDDPLEFLLVTIVPVTDGAAATPPTS